MSTQQRPILEGVRILDFTRVMSGPLCTAMLADLGAEVIKVEEPHGGDISRVVPPLVDSVSAYFGILNRNKKSIALDLKSTEGQRIAKQLMASADIVVENFRPGVMSRLGLGWKKISLANPRLIYASISGFGQSGRFAKLPAYDLIVQAMSGLMHATGQAEGPPTAVGESITDACAGVFASWGILAALFDREKTGQGRRVDVAMLDSILAMMATNVSQELNGGEQSFRRGSRHPATCPVDEFQARDGSFVVVCFGDKPFRKLVTAIDMPGLADNPRFATNEMRLKHEPELKEILNRWAAEKTVESALTILRGADLPCAPVWSLRTLIEDGYLEERGLLQQAFSMSGQKIEVTSQPVRFDGSRGDAVATIPELGAQTSHVLSTVLGLGADEIARLGETGVFGDLPVRAEDFTV